MNNNPSLGDIITTCFIGTWVVLMIGGFFLLHLGKDAAFKRKWFPRYVILGGVLFVAFSTAISTAMFAPSRTPHVFTMLAFMVPMVVLISYLNIKMTRFCDQCGLTIYNQTWLHRMKFCSSCGAELDAKPKPDRDLLE